MFHLNSSQFRTTSIYLIFRCVWKMEKLFIGIHSSCCCRRCYNPLMPFGFALLYCFEGAGALCHPFLVGIIFQLVNINGRKDIFFFTFFFYLMGKGFNGNKIQMKMYKKRKLNQGYVIHWIIYTLMEIKKYLVEIFIELSL